mmetsp:Transcript_27093/g.40938  ORF Transcript_27093/g.40938 Transcript_27093/m.40938 type:complete len:90 (-) Transcript_27093:103-372(-)
MRGSFEYRSLQMMLRYGVGPSTVPRFCVDLFDKYPSLNYSKEIKKKKVIKVHSFTVSSMERKVLAIRGVSLVVIANKLRHLLDHFLTLI